MKKIDELWRCTKNYGSDIKSIIFQKNENTKEIVKEFHSLTAASDADKDGAYCKMLNFALQNDEVYNIAVTGPYGSGKSSVIKTFKSNYNKFKYLDISLATFKNTDDVAQNENDTQNSNKALQVNRDSPLDIASIEKSILQQLFYSVSQDELPRSRLKRIVEVKKRLIWSWSLFSIMWLVYALFLFFPDNKLLNDLLPLKEFRNVEFVKYEILFIFLMLSATILFLFYSFFEKIQEFKLKFQDAEITVSNSSNSSVLNNHLDEVIYFFERTKFDVIIFEDLDRFGDNEIFVRLRELNTLINNSKNQIKRKIVFLYAIKDSMFKDKDRTKFFDVIVPIIPIINPTNAYDLIKERFLNNGVLGEKHGLDNYFINQISLHFDDMRLLTNIFNEFKIYSQKLHNLNINKNKLLALMIYKNYHPKDFSNLHSNFGVLFDLFNSRKIDFKENCKIDIKDNITIDKNKLSETEKNLVNSIKELRMIYVFELSKHINGAVIQHNMQNWGLVNIPLSISININGTSFQFDDSILDDETFSLLSQSTSFILMINNLQKQLTFSSIEKSVDPQRSYLQREQIVKNSLNRQDILNSIKKMELALSNLDSANLSELLEKHSKIDFFDEACHGIMIRYLVKNNWISEDYPTYISYFFDSDITINDKNFAMLNSENGSPAFDVELFKVKETIFRFLKPEYFKNKSILNFSLVDYILSHVSEYQVQIENLFIQLSDKTDESYSFIIKYITRNNCLDVFLNELISRWGDIWDNIERSEDNESKNLILEKLINFIHPENLVFLSNDKTLQSALSARTDFIEYSKKYSIDNKKLLAFLDAVSPRFTALSCSNDDLDLFNLVCSKGFFAICPEMILNILVLNNDDSLSNEIKIKFQASPYTAISNYEPNYLLPIINDHLELFVENIVLRVDGVLSEDIDKFISLLNHDQIGSSHKVEIIKRSSTILDVITAISDKSLWPEFFENSRVTPKWINILNFFHASNNEIHDELIDFLNIEDNFTSLSNERISDQVIDAGAENQKDICDNLEKSILLCNQLSNESYTALQNSITYRYTNIDLSTLDSIKITSLISHEGLAFDQYNIDQLRALIPDQSSLFLESNLEKLMSSPELSLTVEQCIQLLRSKKLNGSFIIEFSSIFCQKYIDDANLCDAIITSCVSNNLAIPDFVIASIFTTNKSMAIKVKALSHQINFIKNQEIFSLLTKMDAPYNELAYANDHKYPAESIPNAILQKLERSGYISSSKSKSNGLLKLLKEDTVSFTTIYKNEEGDSTNQ